MFIGRKSLFECNFPISRLLSPSVSTFLLDQDLDWGLDLDLNEPMNRFRTILHTLFPKNILRELTVSIRLTFPNRNSVTLNRAYVLRSMSMSCNHFDLFRMRERQFRRFDIERTLDLASKSNRSDRCEERLESYLIRRTAD